MWPFRGRSLSEKLQYYCFYFFYETKVPKNVPFECQWPQLQTKMKHSSDDVYFGLHFTEGSNQPLLLASVCTTYIHTQTLRVGPYYGTVVQNTEHRTDIQHAFEYGRTTTTSKSGGVPALVLRTTVCELKDTTVK